MNYYHRELYPKYMVKMQDNFKEHLVMRTVTIKKKVFNVNMYVCVLTCIYLLFFFLYTIYIKLIRIVPVFGYYGQ